MKVLWLCNVMIPAIAEQLNMEITNKEGWITGLADIVMKKKFENGIELAIAFPTPESMFPDGHDVCMREIMIQGNAVSCYGFLEDVNKAEVYDPALEGRLKKIIDSFHPDIIHCFGTEYPHTLAMCRVFPEKSRLLIGIQGLCTVCADAYFANLPETVLNTVTLRDRLKKDSIIRQQEKFVARGKAEVEALKIAKNVTGRTELDRFYTREWNPEANYYNMNETLRKDFYGVSWSYENCEPYTIFVSQADYPLKGLHYLLNAMPFVLAKYPKTKVYIAGNSIVKYETLKDKLKISAYGKYLRKLIRDNQLTDKVVFLGKLTSEEMKEQYLKRHLFVCCSTMENSPNSLGEAMLLGMPCVAADVGGIPSIFNDGEDGILYKGFRNPEIKFGQDGASNKSQEEQMDMISRRLAKAIIEMWSDRERMEEYCDNARRHAQKTHKGERNYAKLNEIYTKMFMNS